MKTLALAEKETGKMLQPDINVQKEITSLRKKITDKFRIILERLEDSLEKADFVAAANAKCRAEMFFRSLENFILHYAKDRYQSALGRYNNSINRIPHLVQKCLDTQFVDCHELTRSLSTLKQCHESEIPEVAKLGDLYTRTVKDLEGGIKGWLWNVDKIASESQYYSFGIVLFQNLMKQLNFGLREHITMELENSCRGKLESWKELESKQDEELDFRGGGAAQKLEGWSKRLDKLKNPDPSQQSIKWMPWNKRYEEAMQKLCRKITDIFHTGQHAVSIRNFYSLKDSMVILQAIHNHVSSHITLAGKHLATLKNQSTKAFFALADDIRENLEKENLVQFEAQIVEFNGFILHIPDFLDDDNGTKQTFSLVNQLVYDHLSKKIQVTIDLFEFKDDVFDFRAVKNQVEKTRSFGGFIADNFTLLEEQYKYVPNGGSDKWLSSISTMCAEHFSPGRVLSKIKHFAILGVVPSASNKEIRDAFKQKARQTHPDKRKHDSMDQDEGAEFRRIKEAHDVLIDAFEKQKLNSEQPFDVKLLGLASSLRKKVKEFQDNQCYSLIETVLANLPDLKEIKKLVKPELDTQQIQKEVVELLQNHVQKLKNEVDTNWQSQKYRALNDNITELQQMERELKSNIKDIFPSSWNGGIIETVKKQIRHLNKKACGLIGDKKSAKDNEAEFKQCLIEMGSVLVELPLFKSYTKRLMCEVLEHSLRFEWGYSYLFELGLSLQRGDGDQSEDEIRVSHMILAEFSHFKEVMTMAWNTETTQKPVEDTVLGIIGQDLSTEDELDVDREGLLHSFTTFECKYTELLGIYIRPDMDPNDLADLIVSMCDDIRMVSCEDGWQEATKKKIPCILAGVFALFTVCKSGESFNRIEDSAEAADLVDKILMRPHNIQVLTLLKMFGCDDCTCNSLESQLLQIRTGEGKSMILGAAASVLGLLGYNVRCVCYSEYLSSRDFALFEDIFKMLRLDSNVKYSKITALSEDTTTAKGDIRALTDFLLHVSQSNGSCSNATGVVHSRTIKGPALPEEILLVDEVDVFFGSDFYGQTYNQVTQLCEPEIRDILHEIWKNYQTGGRRHRIADIKTMAAYKRLIAKYNHFGYMIDNEIALMLDQVARVDEEPYFLDNNDQIGYKVMDSVNYNVTCGYQTVFAYLKEFHLGRLKNGVKTLDKVLCMNISCGQFSYANINPKRILGVSGTLEAMGDFQKGVLRKYGIEKFLFMPSVYGKSNFTFDKAGDGIFIEKDKSDFYQRICTEINKETAKNRAVIVFFLNRECLKDFEGSAFYRKLGRQKAILTEDMDKDEKDFIVKKAATAKQITICSAVFGRGTDFFCKDSRVAENGGVHVIQTFLSEERSEEIQIQGRTARQGKTGSYQMILLQSHLQEHFGVDPAEIDKIVRSERYDWLCRLREERYKTYCDQIISNLAEATIRDEKTHAYFDALLQNDYANARTLFQDIYQTVKKPPLPSNINIDLCLLIDVTGSMRPYMTYVRETTVSLLHGQASVVAKLKSKFPEIDFKLRVAVMPYRDIDDKTKQYENRIWQNQSHFTDDINDVLHLIQSSTKQPSGGCDIAEDHFGAITQCANWVAAGDWTGNVKLAMLFTDAPAHGMVPQGSAAVPNADSHAVRHPLGLTAESVADALLTKDINLFFCSFNPSATAVTEQELSEKYLKNDQNANEQEITVIPMVQPSPSNQNGASVLSSAYGQHIIFVLDESGSMSHNWAGVVSAYRGYMDRRIQNQYQSDLVSVVQFDNSARVTVSKETIGSASRDLDYNGGGTCYQPAAENAQAIARATPSSFSPVVVFMSDGLTEDGDAIQAANTFRALNSEFQSKYGCDLELHVIAFGAGLDARQLQQIAQSSPAGKVYTSSDTVELATVFVSIAQSSQDVASLVEKEVGSRISDTVTNKLSLEYLG